MKTQTRTKSPIRRRIVSKGVAGGIHNARIKSLTRDDDTVYDTHVDLENGRVFCHCGDFFFRHAKFEPTVRDAAHHCKHIARHIELCRRHDELVIVDARPCAKCGAADAEFEMCDDTGNVQLGWICAICATKRREAIR